MTDRMFTISSVLIIISVFVLAGLVMKGKADCDSQGGKYVKGVFWYECVEVRK